MDDSPTSAPPNAALAAPRAAVDDGRWQRAVELLDEAGAAGRTAEGLELRALAEYGAGRFEAAVTAWEELFALRSAEGDDAEAARAAAMVALYLMMDTGLMAPVRGWLRRADRLVADQPDAPAHAVCALVRTYERFMCGDIPAARREAAVAIELGERLDVPPAVVIGRVASARVAILDGDLESGLDLLDDVAVALMSGEVDALTTGMMYCELICAAQGLGMYERAAEWTEVMARWSPGGAVGGIGGRCRVHRAEMLRLTGPCDAAEEEALLACDELRPWMRREFGWPLVELGNIRLRRGDLDGAEEAYRAAHEHAWTPHPGLALVRLEQGDVDAATALVADAIARPVDIPSKERPPFGELRLAPLLDAQVEIACAAGDEPTARRAAAALAATAATYATTGLAAASELATARVALLAGDPDTAIAAGSRAIAGWATIPAPFEQAVARTLLGDAHHAAGNPAPARMEWRAAHDAFAAFGAQRWVERTARRLSGEPARPAATTGGRGATAETTRATFTTEGDTRRVSFAGRTTQLRDLKGFRYLARLLADPGREFHALDLVAVEGGSLPTGRAIVPADDDLTVDADAGAGLPVLDDQARESYRRRLADVDEDIEDARAANDPVRAELAERDRDFLLAELGRAVGLGGRHRTTGGDAERARTSVTRSIRYALGRLAEHHRPLATHLENCVRTGTYCSYTPDPLAPVEWRHEQPDDAEADPDSP